MTPLDTSIPQLRSLVADLDRPGLRVLDAGCGDGRLADLFDHAHYTGIDASGECVRKCRAKVLDVWAGSVYLPPYADLVICHNVLGELDDMAAALRALWNAAQRRLVFTVYVQPWWRWPKRGMVARWMLALFIRRELKPARWKIKLSAHDAKDGGRLAYVTLDRI